MTASGAALCSALALAAASLGGCRADEPPRDGTRSVDVPPAGLRPTDSPCQHGADEYIDANGEEVICGPIVIGDPWPDPDPGPTCEDLPGGCFPDPEPEPPPEPPPAPEPPPEPGPNCVALGAACAGAVAASVPTCAACAGVVTCIACAGTVAASIGACSEWNNQCVNARAREGDPCVNSYACEQSGLHCVDNVCSRHVGTEGQRCAADRDCQTGTTCLLDGAGLDPRTNLPYGGKCWRKRGAGEDCTASAECQWPLQCDHEERECRTPTCGEILGPPVPGCTCTDTAQCPSGYECNGGRCEGVTVTVCNCDGTDPPGTCQACEPP